MGRLRATAPAWHSRPDLAVAVCAVKGILAIWVKGQRQVDRDLALP